MPVFAKEKPRSCRYCLYYRKKKGCCLGEENCYFIVKAAPKPQIPKKCEGCPYIHDNACIGSCYKKLLPGIWGTVE